MGGQGASPSTDRPLRMCVGCRRRFQKRWLVRFAVAGRRIVVDVDQRLPGRGAYLCWRTECATQVLEDGRRLAQALRTTRDRVTVDSGALLQDWTATRRDRCGGTGTEQLH
ncbi:MAG: YlxR family protein, partial [Actinobacteria bacterium]|nr:YlxR family protein [Actinomycetota bacterium]